MSLPRTAFLLLTGLLAASACPGGSQSRVCQQYFELSEQCAAKSTPERAAELRSLAKLAREGFEKNKNNDPGVEASCKQMLDTLSADPTCK